MIQKEEHEKPKPLDAYSPEGVEEAVKSAKHLASLMRGADRDYRQHLFAVWMAILKGETLPGYRWNRSRRTAVWREVRKDRGQDQKGKRPRPWTLDDDYDAVSKDSDILPGQNALAETMERMWRRLHPGDTRSLPCPRSESEEDRQAFRQTVCEFLLAPFTEEDAKIWLTYAACAPSYVEAGRALGMSKEAVITVVRRCRSTLQSRFRLFYEERAIANYNRTITGEPNA